MLMRDKLLLAYWIFLALFGLYFQALYPPALVIAFIIGVFVTIIFVNRIHKPDIWVASFVTASIIISFVLPVFFSKMPMYSYSTSMYLLVGGMSLLFINDKFSEALLTALVVYVGISTLVSIIQMMVYGVPRPNGIFMDANVSAIYSMVSGFYVFWQISKSPSVFLGKVPACLWLLLLLVLIGFHSSQSRLMMGMGVLGVLFLWIYGFFIDKKARPVILGLTVTSVIAFLIFHAIFQWIPNSGLAYFNKPEGADVRFTVWLSTWEMIKDSPLFGSGFGLFKLMYPEVRAELYTAGDFVHNDYLELWFSSGIIGLILICIPTMYFAKQFLSSFFNSNTKKTIFSGIGLCLLGFSFFNYFFWRFENLLILASVWRLSRDDVLTDRIMQIRWKQRVYVVVLVLLPVTATLARIEEESILLTHGGLVPDVPSWSNIVMGGQSQLIPFKVRWYIDISHSRNLNIEESNALRMLVFQLNGEAARETRYATVYCARGEVGYIFNEDYGISLDFISKGEIRDSQNVYCAYARFQVNRIYGKKIKALEDVKVFLSRRLLMEQASELIALDEIANDYAIQVNEIEYSEFFTMHKNYLLSKLAN